MRNYENLYLQSFEQIRFEMISALSEKFGDKAAKIYRAAAFGKQKNLSIARIKKDCEVNITTADLQYLKAIREAVDMNLTANMRMLRALKSLEEILQS